MADQLSVTDKIAKIMAKIQEYRATVRRLHGYLENARLVYGNRYPVAVATAAAGLLNSLIEKPHWDKNLIVEAMTLAAEAADDHQKMLIMASAVELVTGRIEVRVESLYEPERIVATFRP